MLPHADRLSFGREVAKLRRAKGLRQQDIVDRISTYYGDVSSYRRIESGRRLPEREAAIAIVARGLLISDPAAINSVLSLAGYEGLTEEDTQRFGLQQPVGASIQKPPLGRRPVIWDRVTAPLRIRYIPAALAGVAVTCTFAVSAIFSARTQYENWFCLLLCTMYASLYVVSLLLESAYAPQTRKLWVTVLIFGLMMLTSVTALWADAQSVTSGTGNGLVIALAIFAIAAILQALISRAALPNYPVVKGDFHTHTAQSAHLKNTSYFLVIVVFFWIPPVHAISLLRRELHSGHIQFVRDTLAHWVLLGHGIISLNFGWLIGMFLFLIVLSLPMRSKLVDSLPPNPHKNAYLYLFYARALLYFALTGTCVFWYVNSVGSLVDQIS